VNYFSDAAQKEETKLAESEGGEPDGFMNAAPHISQSPPDLSISCDAPNRNKPHARPYC
jgi:hypothetical protein